jgi:outer membrane receptor protein involved in Fe transport
MVNGARRAFLVTTSLFALWSGPGLAQTAAAGDQADAAEIVVTGSYLRGSALDGAAPVSVVGRGAIDGSGFNNTTDLVRLIPSASGSRLTPDSTNSPFQVGTAQINLRGLGFASTLTLVNSRRHVAAAVPADDGTSYVDINQIPLIMLERIEILKDGGAALYGSDAIAGVANLILRQDVKGLELRGSWQETTESGQRDLYLGGVGGLQIGRGSITFGMEYLDRTPLGFNDRPFSRGRTVSGLGFPGAFAPGPLPIIDPGCAAAGGQPAPFGIPGAPQIGLCRVDLSGEFNLIVAEQRLTGYLTGNLDIRDNLRLVTELGFAANRATVQSGPSFSNLKFPVVPANNPGNLVANGGFGVPVTFFGRPLSSANFGPTIQGRSSDMLRAVIGLEGEMASAWEWQLTYGYSWNQFRATGVRDVKIDRFDAALVGRGGPNNNQFFNPFASSVLNPALANSEAVIRDFLADSWRRYTTSLNTVDAVVTGSLFDLPGGPAGLAVGGQFRRETLGFASDPDSRNRNLTFLFTGPDFTEAQTVWAAFAELGLPVLPRADVQLAARYDHYSGGVGGSFNPKAAARIRPTDWLTLRGSVGTSFRAPSLSQVTSISTINGAIADPLNPATIPFFRAIVTVPNADLKPETSVNFNLGAIVEPLDGLRLSVDYWNYRYSDIIVKESAQQIVNMNPNDPRVIRQGGLPRGQISQVNVTFLNANRVVADGIDAALTWRIETASAGRFGLNADLTWFSRYDVTSPGLNGDLSGFRNFENFAPAIPELRTNFSADWALGAHSAVINVRRISAYRENLANPASPVNGFRLRPVTTVDLQYGLDIARTGTRLEVGGLNIFNALPPIVGIPGDLTGFDSETHDPRGAMLYARIVQRF